MIANSTDCCAEPGNVLLSVEEGRTRILDHVSAIHEFEQLPLRSALGRVIAEPIQARIDVPPFTNSAMDGYAVRSASCHTDKPNQLTVCGQSFAGTPFDGSVSDGECVRIMTGAVLPKDTDAVLMQEHVQREDDIISFTDCEIGAGLNVRYAGEDLHCGDTILSNGKRIGAAELGLLASVGIGEIRVYRRLRVAFFSTGDELTGVGQTLESGQIYDSNRYTLHGMLSKLDGVELIDLGVIPDQRDAVRAAFKQAGNMADLVLTSGGVSVGEADYVTDTLAELGKIHFWKMAMKPGKPLAFGKLGNAAFFGLPGNPVSVMATFYQFVLPALHKISGAEAQAPLLIRACCDSNLRKSPGRSEFQRGILSCDASGQATVSTTGLQGSHVLSSMSKANCFILLDADSNGVKPGELVTVQPFGATI